MPNKTSDLEYVISAALQDAGGPLTLETLLERFGAIDDPRWVGVALMHLRRDGVIRYATCDADHNHGGLCAVELLK
jgi:hypothetical protein